MQRVQRIVEDRFAAHLAIAHSKMEGARMRVGILVLALMTMVAEVQSQVTKQSFGKTPDGTPVDLYVLKSGGIEAHIITYGGIVQALKVPDKNGKVADVALGFDSIDGYTGGAKPNAPFFG